jgi:hypothetical protein
MPDTSAPWPVAVASGAFIKKVNISTLSADKKREAWEYLKENHPEVASELQSNLNDPTFQLIMEEFDGGVLIEEKYLPSSCRGLLRSSA